MALRRHGRRRFLGETGTPPSKREFRRLLAKYLPAAGRVIFGTAPAEMAMLMADYLRHFKKHYPDRTSHRKRSRSG